MRRQILRENCCDLKIYVGRVLGTLALAFRVPGALEMTCDRLQFFCFLVFFSTRQTFLLAFLSSEYLV